MVENQNPDFGKCSLFVYKFHMNKICVKYDIYREKKNNFDQL